MRSNLLLMAALVLCSWFAVGRLGYAASQSESLTIGYSSFSGHYVPLWIAIEDQLGKKYGLDLAMTNNLFDRISIDLRSWLKNFRKISIDTVSGITCSRCTQH